MAKARSKTPRKRKKYKVELTSLSAILWGVFAFFLLTWIFVLGILVGRGSLPGTVTTISDLKEQINRLQAMVGNRKAYDSRVPDESDTSMKLDFYETLTEKRDEAKKNWPTENTLTEQKKEPVETEVAAPAKKEEKESSEEIIENRIKELESRTVRDAFTVQIASFAELDKAEKLIRDLISQGIDAYYYEASIKGKTYYRIRCGRFDNRNEAQDYIRKVEEASGFKGFVSRME